MSSHRELPVGLESPNPVSPDTSARGESIAGDGEVVGRTQARLATPWALLCAVCEHQLQTSDRIEMSTLQSRPSGMGLCHPTQNWQGVCG